MVIVDSALSTATAAVATNLANEISATNTDVAALKVVDSALSNALSAEITATGNEISNLVIVDSALSTATAAVATNLANEISATNTDVAALKVVDSALSNALSAEITATGNEISNLVIVDSALSTAIAANATSIAALGHEMDEVMADVFVSPTQFDFSSPNQFLSGPDKDVLVFINGMKIDERDFILTQNDIKFSGLGYALDGTDEVIVYGRI